MYQNKLTMWQDLDRNSGVSKKSDIWKPQFNDANLKDILRVGFVARWRPQQTRKRVQDMSPEDSQPAQTGIQPYPTYLKLIAMHSRWLQAEIIVQVEETATTIDAFAQLRTPKEAK